MAATPLPAAGLLALPRELRDLILEYLVLKPTNTVTMLGNFGSHMNDISACTPSICAVNRQLRAESLPMFYSGNIFTAQLDNTQDLETANRWLRAIRDENIHHLKHVVLCGWTRVPFGHMFARRWIRVVLHLKHGVMDVGSKDGDYTAESRCCPGPDELHHEATATLEELKDTFHDMVEARAGNAFDVGSLAELMTGFNLLCTGY